MAGEGLFFSGVVLKNNRNLLQEEAVRQQLALRREELNLSKAQLEDQRKEARRKKLEPIKYSASDIDSNLVPAYRDEYNNYVQFIADNQDSDELDTQMQIRAADVISHAEILKDITSKLQTYDEQAIDNSDIFKKDDQGNLLYNQIFNNIVLQYNQTGDIEEALKKLPKVDEYLEKRPEIIDVGTSPKLIIDGIEYETG